MTLNLKKPEGVALARELIAHCDVVVENFGPGVMSGLGLGYAELAEVKSDIVMFSMPAAGLYGPLSNLRTYGLSLASITGMDSLTGYDDGPPSRWRTPSPILSTASWARSRFSSR
ncbi:MAG: CoA transferase [Acidimicrobiia bacterium]|nr:CoA transferase [Acidimicrobiia bacterium]